MIWFSIMQIRTPTILHLTPFFPEHSGKNCVLVTGRVLAGTLIPGMRVAVIPSHAGELATCTFIEEVPADEFISVREALPGKGHMCLRTQKRIRTHTYTHTRARMHARSQLAPS